MVSTSTNSTSWIALGLLHPKKASCIDNGRISCHYRWCRSVLLAVTPICSGIMKRDILIPGAWVWIGVVGLLIAQGLKKVLNVIPTSIVPLMDRSDRIKRADGYSDGLSNTI